MLNKDEIIRMAREAGFNPDYFDNIGCSCDECNFLKEPLERFAALVAAHEREKQVEQEPVAWLAQDDTFWLEKGSDTDIPLYAAPVRTKDLTDDDVAKAIAPFQHEFIATGRTTMNFARSVIAADRELNK